MANYTVDPVTGILIPTPGQDPGEDYAVNISNALGTLAHLTHTGAANQDGYQIPAAGLNIDADVSIQNNNLTNLRSTQFNSQGAPLSGVGDLDCVYVNGGDLWYNNGSGTPVQITSGSSIDVSVPNNLILQATSTNLTISSTATYNVVDVHSNASAITITLPLTTDVPDGRFFYIKDVDGYAATNNITIRPESPDVLDGASSAVITTGFQAILLVSNNNGSWRVYPFDKTSYNNGDNLNFNPGSTLTMTGGASSPTVLDMDGYSVLYFNENSGVVWFSGSTGVVQPGADIYMSGFMEIQKEGSNPGAELRVTNGSFLTLDQGSQQNVNTGAEININNNGEINVASGGAVNLGSGSAMNFTSGSTLNGTMTVANNSTINFPGSGGDGQINFNGSNYFNLGASAAINNLGNTINVNWPTWQTPITRTLIQPVQYGLPVSGTFTTLIQGVSDNAAGGVWTITLDRLQNGGTLSSIVLSWSVGLSHSNVPASLPNLSTARYKFGSEFSPVTLSSTDPQVLPTPGSGSAYYASGGVKTLTYTCNQHNVIDNTQYYYAVIITDESGSNSLADNNFFNLQLNYTAIPDQSWNI